MAAENSEVNRTLAGKAEDMGKLVEYSAGSVVSRTILDKPAGTLTLFAFDVGQGLSEHRAPFDAVVQVIEGVCDLTIGPSSVTVRAGQVIIMPADVPHSVAAPQRFKMLLTMIRQKD